jgi:hypothetical protein
MIEYRPANPSDAEAIASLHARSWRENYRGALHDAFLDGDLREERLRVWHERLDHPPDNQLVQLAVFLAERFAVEGDPVEMTVSGHSLDGALSPTLALWLLDTQKQWDHHDRAMISVYAYAGPTPGNDAFASYFDARFGDRVHRIANPLDVVTHALNVGDLADLKALYTPEILRDALWDKAVDAAIAATNGIRYRQIDPSPVLLNGKVKEDLVWSWAPRLLNLAAQVLYQHTLAYFKLMDLEYPDERSVLGRHLAQQTDAFPKELLSRAGVGALLARVLAAGLRLFTEVYSRTSFVPSPLPEMSAPDA